MAAVAVQDSDDVPLQVLHIVVAFPIIKESQQAFRVVIQEIQAVVPGDLGQDRRAIQIVFRLNPVYHLLHPDPRVVVVVGCICPGLREGGQLPPMLPGEGYAVPIGERVADLVVGDGLAIVTGQLVLPVGICVPVDRILKADAIVYINIKTKQMLKTSAPFLIA